MLEQIALLLISIMALSTKNETDLTEFILPGQAASLLSKHIEIEDVQRLL